MTLDDWKEKYLPETTIQEREAKMLEEGRGGDVLANRVIQDRHHCKKCNSQRQGAVCWKCGTETITPSAAWEYPHMPPINTIRALAKEVGYAIAVHGSQERDLDLIAAPWTDDAVGNADLIKHLCNGLPCTLVDAGHKPLGRYAVNLQMNGYYKLIDLSICPRSTDTKTAAPLIGGEAK